LGVRALRAKDQAFSIGRVAEHRVEDVRQRNLSCSDPGVSDRIVQMLRLPGPTCRVNAIPPPSGDQTGPMLADSNVIRRVPRTRSTTQTIRWSRAPRTRRPPGAHREQSQSFRIVLGRVQVDDRGAVPIDPSETLWLLGNSG
jgi:hypothetical protein